MPAPTLAEMTAWSAEEIERAIIDKLPSGWTLRHSQIGFFRAILYDERGTVQWIGESFDERLLLLDVFGWLLLREAPRPENGPWVPRRRELTHRVVASAAEVFADPPDLDPEELDAVYSSIFSKGQRG